MYTCKIYYNTYFQNPILPESIVAKLALLMPEMNTNISHSQAEIINLYFLTRKLGW
jgi:hypothetical protein